MLAENHVAVARWQDTPSDGGLGADPHLPPARRPPELLDTVGEDGRPSPPGPDVPTAGEERVRPLHADVTGIEVVSLSPAHPVPLKRLQPVLRKQGEAIVRVEDVDVGGTEPRAL